MKITIEPTQELGIFEFGDGYSIPCRLWQGTTEEGVRVLALVAIPQTHDPAALADFELIDADVAGSA